jgi:hypothetical protein
LAPLSVSSTPGDQRLCAKQASQNERAGAEEEEEMPIATMTRTVTLPDGTIKRTIEKQHKDGNGNILRIMSKTEEIIAGPADVLVAVAGGGGVINKATWLPDTTRPKVADLRLDDPKHKQDNFLIARLGSHDTSPLLDDPQEQDDYLIARLRNNASHRNSSSSHNGSSTSIQSGMSGHHQTGRDGSSSSIQSTHSLQGTRSGNSGGGDSLVDHLRRVNLQNKSPQQVQAPVVTNARPVHPQRPNNVRREEESPLPAIMVQAQPLLHHSNQFTIKKVSMENWLPDGTVVVRTEKHKVYADGSVHVLESHNVPVVSAPKPPAMNSPTIALPTTSTRVQQTPAVPTNSSSPKPSAVLPSRIRTDALPRSPGSSPPATTTTTTKKTTHYSANSSSAMPNWGPTLATSSPQPPAVAALPVSIPTAAMPQSYRPTSAKTTTTATNTSAVNYTANSVQTYVPSNSSPFPAAVVPVSIPTAVMPQASGPSPAAATTTTSNATNNGQQLPKFLPAVVVSRPMPQPPQQQQQQVQQKPNGGGGIDHLQLAEGVLNLFERANNIFGGGESEPDNSGDININFNIGDTAQQQQQQQQSNTIDSINNTLRWANAGLTAGKLAVNLLGLNTE